MFFRPVSCLLLPLLLSACSASYAYELVEVFPDLKFERPVDVVSPPNDSSRLFVVEQHTGLIKEIDLRSNKAEVFLDLSSRPGGEKLATGNEQGVLGLAFHPDYSRNREFYVFYTPKKGRKEQYNRLSRFIDRGSGREETEEILINQFDEAGNHNGGDLEFGPDGYLYVSVGDEGAANDKLDNSQRLDKDFFTGILRIDVDQKPGNLEPNPHPAVNSGTYKVPRDNPFVDLKEFGGENLDPRKVRTEFWAHGLRNAWRFTILPESGKILTGDVGQNRHEEIDLVEKGGNYGWAFREGFHKGPKKQPPGVEAADPIYEYGRKEGVSVTGGVVYRGDDLPRLRGSYLFADFASGRIWALQPQQQGKPKVVQIAKESGISSFGVDPRDGEPLLVDLNGPIWKLTRPGE